MSKPKSKAKKSKPQVEAPAGLKRYSIVREIGRGAMGVVFLAHDDHEDRDVALKELLLPDTATPEKKAELIERFEREAELASGLDNTAIVRTFGSFVDEDRHFIVMEYVDAETLAEVLKRGALPAQAALGVTTQVLSALVAAQAAGIVHRDLKPENVFVLADGGVKVADFGIARTQDSAGLTVAGQVMGTIGYMSPEQVRGAEIDGRSDVFAVGVMLHEMLIGTNPFHAEQPTTTMYRISYEDPPALDPFVDGLPAFVTPVIRKATAKDPDLRYQNAQEMMHDIENCAAPDVSQIMAAAAVRKAPDTADTTTGKQRWRPRISNKIVIAAGLALVLMAGTAGGAYVVAQKKAQEEAARKAAIIIEGKKMAQQVARLKALRLELDACVEEVSRTAARNQQALDRWSDTWDERQRKYKERYAAVDRHNEQEAEKWRNSETTEQYWNGWYWEYTTTYTYTEQYWDYPKEPKKPAKVKVNLNPQNKRLARLSEDLNTFRSEVASSTPQSRFFGPVYQQMGVTAQTLGDAVDDVRTMMAGVVGKESRGQTISRAKVSSINLGALDAPFQQLDQSVTSALTMNRVTLAEIVPSASETNTVIP